MTEATYSTCLPALSFSSMPSTSMGESQPSDADLTVTLPLRSAVAILRIQGSSGVLATAIGRHHTTTARVASIVSSRHR